MKKRYAIISAICLVLILLGLWSFSSLRNAFKEGSTVAPYYAYIVNRSYPHDPHAFTEGLIYDEGFFYESTGLYGSSTLRCVDLETGTVIQEIALPSKYFGEGIALVNQTLFQLTWRSQIGFVYDKSSLKVLGNFTYSGEGWGLTYDGKSLIMSNGSDVIAFRDPTDFSKSREIIVHDGNSSVFNLNELEYLNGEIYANIWHKETMAIINPENGQVNRWINLTGISETAISSLENVLNGIAYDSENDRLFVTGKDWPRIYEITVAEQLS